MKLIRVITPCRRFSSSWMMKPPSLLRADLPQDVPDHRVCPEGRVVPVHQGAHCPRQQVLLGLFQGRRRRGSPRRQARRTSTRRRAVSFPMHRSFVSTTGRKEKWLAVRRSHAFSSVSFSFSVIEVFPRDHDVLDAGSHVGGKRRALRLETCQDELGLRVDVARPLRERPLPS